MSAHNALVKYEEKAVMECFSDQDGLDPIIGEVKKAVRSFDHDMSTASGRAKTASLAHKVAKFKTAIDGLGKDLVADWKTKAKAVDSNRKAMRDAMDGLKIEARKPLDEWEAEQERIKAEGEARIAAEKLAIQRESDHEIAILLNREHDRLKKEAEAEALRLAKEAKEKAEREQKERDDRIAREAAEKVRIEAEEKRLADENKARLEIEAAAKREADARAELKKAEDDRIAAAEKAKQDAIDAEARQAQAVKDAEARARREAEEKRLADERASIAREKDIVHKTKVNKAALSAIIELGISEAHGKALIKAIYIGKVPNVKISY